MSNSTAEKREKFYGVLGIVLPILLIGLGVKFQNIITTRVAVIMLVINVFSVFLANLIEIIQLKVRPNSAIKAVAWFQLLRFIMTLLISSILSYLSIQNENRDEWLLSASIFASLLQGFFPLANAVLTFDKFEKLSVNPIKNQILNWRKHGNKVIKEILDTKKEIQKNKVLKRFIVIGVAFLAMVWVMCRFGKYLI